MEGNQEKLVRPESPVEGQIWQDELGKLFIWIDKKWTPVESKEDRIAQLEEALFNVVHTAVAFGAGRDWIEIEIALNLLSTTKYKDKVSPTF
jgi:hypothetical protein